MSNHTIKQFGAIDIGSNAIRCLITSISTNGKDERFKKLALVRVPIRLGEDVFGKGRVGNNKKERLINALQSYAYLFKAYGVTSYRACATSAMREAENGQEIIKEIQEQTGINVEIITGAEEAKIIFDSSISNLLDDDKSYLYVDVGGGSTELTIFSDHKIIASKSFKIGTVRILQNKSTPEEWDNIKTWIEENVDNKKLECLIGSGGNINKLVKLAPSKNKEKTIEQKDLKDLFADLSELTYEERMNEYSLNPDRADVIIPAAKIFLSVLRWTDTNTIFAPKVGLADGIIHELNSVN
jgi:exopolyphosphatase/guanosine-5'-triphosphate,3'-diphosphate pyrophosphatase